MDNLNQRSRSQSAHHKCPPSRLGTIPQVRTWRALTPRLDATRQCIPWNNEYRYYVIVIVIVFLMSNCMISRFKISHNDERNLKTSSSTAWPVKLFRVHQTRFGCFPFCGQTICPKEQPRLLHMFFRGSKHVHIVYNNISSYLLYI